MWRAFKSDSLVAVGDTSATQDLRRQCEEMECQRQRALKLNTRLKKRVVEMHKKNRSVAEPDVTEWDIQRCRERLIKQNEEFSRCLLQLREKSSERQLMEDKYRALKQKHKDEKYCNVFLKEDLGRLEERLSRQRMREEKCKQKTEENRVLCELIAELREQRSDLRAQTQEQQRVLRTHRLQKCKTGCFPAGKVETPRDDHKRWVALCGNVQSDIAFFEDRSAKFRAEIRALEERIRAAKGKDGSIGEEETGGGNGWLRTLQKELQAW